MFTAMYDGLASKRRAERPSRVGPLWPPETVEIAGRNIAMSLSLLTHDQCTGPETLPSILDPLSKLLSVLDKHLERPVDRDEDLLNRISGRRHGDEVQRILSAPVENAARYYVGKRVVDKMRSLSCLFTWGLGKPDKDIIARVSRKYGNYNLDVSVPAFTFDRFILNVIIAHQLFHADQDDAAKIVIVLVGKWLEELDDGSDEFYRSISDGLKHVLMATFVHMRPSKYLTNKNIRQLLCTIKPFSDLNHESKAAVYAIKAAVLIEYGDDEDDFEKAVKCTTLACDFNPTGAYWFYFHSLAQTACRNHKRASHSCPSKNEMDAIQQAIFLSNTSQNPIIMYHEIILFKDITLSNFHSNKNNEDIQHLRNTKKLVQMIKNYLGTEPGDPLTVVNCARILMSLPKIVENLSLGKELLVKGLQMAPEDLIVLRAIARVIIVFSRKNNKMKNVCESSQEIPLRNLCEDLKLAVEKHNSGRDPVPFLLGVLTSHEYQIQWKIFAQICSYTILFNDNLELGIKYFMMLVEAEQNGLVNSDLILCHYSSFVQKSRKFNLAELVNNEILIALANNVPNRQLYYSNLVKILNTYKIKLEANQVDRSMRSRLIGELRNNNFRVQQNEIANGDNQNVTNNQNVQPGTQNSYISMNMRRPRSPENRLSNANVEHNNTSNISINDNDDNVSIDSYKNYKCCRCSIM